MAAEEIQRVAVVILNWNGWRDTIECLESVFRLDYPHYQVVVCDNGSEDGSLERIRAWAEGSLAASVDGPPWLSLPPGVVSKPVTYVEYSRAEAEATGETARDAALVLIQTGANLGFAGGNNVGLRYMLARGNFAYAWLLNNDTVVRPDALRSLVRRMSEKPAAGMCGSTLLYYHRPDKVQAWAGGSYNRLRGVSRHLGVLTDASVLPNVAEVEADMAYVIGASMLVSQVFLRQVGVMNETYFLYYEEIDWACRARGRFDLAYAASSMVYHKEGGTVGSSHTGQPSLLSVKFLYGNRLKFARRFFPQFVPTNWLRMAFECLVFLKRKQFKVAHIVLLALLGLLRLPIPKKF